MPRPHPAVRATEKTPASKHAVPEGAVETQASKPALSEGAFETQAARQHELQATPPPSSLTLPEDSQALAATAQVT